MEGNQTGIVVNGFMNAQKISTLVFNRFKVKIGLLSINSSDTVFNYAISIETKVNKKQFESIRYYIMGVIDCIKSY